MTLYVSIENDRLATTDIIRGICVEMGNAKNLAKTFEQLATKFNCPVPQYQNSTQMYINRNGQCQRHQPPTYAITIIKINIYIAKYINICKVL